MIHGVTDGCVAWAQIARCWKAGCHCYIVEYRGNGMTEAGYGTSRVTRASCWRGDIIEMIEKLDLQDIHVVGHSWIADHADLSSKDPAAGADYTTGSTRWWTAGAIRCFWGFATATVISGPGSLPGWTAGSVPAGLDRYGKRIGSLPNGGAGASRQMPMVPET